MTTICSLLDSEDDIPSSPSSITSSLPPMDTATCFPPVFDSVTPNPSVKDKRRFYNVYSGDQCGCFRDWSDASGRVSRVKGNRYKAYDTWEEALDGWRQNCRSYHHHPADFVDGTLFHPETTSNVPEAAVPPPSQHNIVFLARAASSSRPSTPRRPAVRPSSPASPSKHCYCTSTSTSHAPRHWAVSSTDFNGVVSTMQASRLFDEAVGDRREVDMREISSFDEALEWFNRLSLST
ncbi:hypothetical protein BT96DRAFT_993803 [Gymnopus androsaceus JB14]|uniref:Ribonuclease H1 N-terminal domain-containing protein n=1 Tax=Gymnopus androsaceus JB14 TaxID=1447944 RepID=A0A6A4HNF4_9AGAR|nr:hypothetical protein BT96DRAFT_993803 [Gymnopus androsaceus JB14]